MSLPAVRIALAGCGRIARAVHLPALASMPDVHVVALADSDPAALDAARLIVPAAQALAQHADLYRRDDVDAVVVCLPSHLHAEAAVATLDAAKALYLEKPIAIDLGAARAVVEAGRRAGLAAMIGFNYRFHPLVAKMRRRVMAGEIGELRTWRSGFSVRAHQRPAWKATLATGGGVLLDLASHHVDLLRFITGSEVRDVFATVSPQGESEEDTAALQLLLDTGVVAQVTCSWSGADEDRIEVSGDAGALAFDRHRSLALEWRGAGAPQSRGELLMSAVPAIDVGYARQRLAAPRQEASYRRALTHFIACVRRGETPAPGLEDGLRSLEVIVAARTSVRDGRLVRVGA